MLSIEDNVHQNVMSTSLCSRKSEDGISERSNTDLELYPSNVIAMQNNCFIKPIRGEKVGVKKVNNTFASMVLFKALEKSKKDI